MADVVMYTTAVCPFCVRAKGLLKKKGVAFEEVDLNAQPERRAEMLEKAEGRRTVPQIFINDQHVGGCDDLYALDAEGRLDALLAD